MKNVKKGGFELHFRISNHRLKLGAKMPKRCYSTAFLGPKPVAEKNRAQKVFLFFIFFQLTQKISARSEKLSALVVKGLTVNV